MAAAAAVHQLRHRHLRLRDHHRQDRRERDLQHPRPQRHARLRDRRAVPEDGLERLGHPAARASRTAACPTTTSWAREARASSSSSRPSTAVASASPRWASASPRARSTRRSSTPRSGRRSASRSPSSRRSRPSSPTCPPRSRRRGSSPTRPPSRRTPARTSRLTAAQAKLKTGRLAVQGLRGGRPDPRRLRLHRGVPRLPLLPRREDPHHRRGDRRGPADGHRTSARLLSRRCPGHPRRCPLASTRRSRSRAPCTPPSGARARRSPT